MLLKSPPIPDLNLEWLPHMAADRIILESLKGLIDKPQDEYYAFTKCPALSVCFCVHASTKACASVGAFVQACVPASTYFCSTCVLRSFQMTLPNH